MDRFIDLQGEPQGIRSESSTSCRSSADESTDSVKHSLVQDLKLVWEVWKLFEYVIQKGANGNILLDKKGEQMRKGHNYKLTGVVSVANVRPYSQGALRIPKHLL